MNDLEQYIEQHIDQEPEYLYQIYRQTNLQMINPRMCSGHLQGRILSMLSKMICPKNILEIGTYTGYSALCLAEGLDENGVLYTIEIDDELEEIILQNINNSPYKENIQLHIGKALDIIPTLNKTFDLALLDADKREYKAYFDQILPVMKKGGFILADNTLWSKKVLKEHKNNDFQTIGIKEFNDYIAQCERVEKVILPIRDGITIMRVK